MVPPVTHRTSAKRGRICRYRRLLHPDGEGRGPHARPLDEDHGGDPASESRRISRQNRQIDRRWRPRRISSALDAVVWAEQVQRAVSLPQDTDPADDLPPIALRISVHLGDVMESKNDIYGAGVNIAARLQEHAEPGGVILSGAVHDLVRGHLNAPSRDLGLLALKNLDWPVQAYALDTGVSGLRVPIEARTPVAVDRHPAAAQHERQPQRQLFFPGARRRHYRLAGQPAPS